MVSPVQNIADSSMVMTGCAGSLRTRVMVCDTVEPHSFTRVHTHVPASAGENVSKLNVEVVWEASAILLCFHVTLVAFGLSRSSVKFESLHTSCVVTS